jgi:hypothetical protein
MRTLMWALAALACAGPAEAIDAKKLLEYCKSPEHSQLNVYCLAYVNGVAETLSALADLGALTGSACVPDGTTLSQMADVVVGYIVSKPKEMYLPASTTVGVALNKAWPPCNKPRK